MATTDCEKISFTKSVYDLGYVHQDTDFSIYPMNFVGVLAVKTEVGLPPGQLTLTSLCPDQIKFVDWLNNLGWKKRLASPFRHMGCKKGERRKADGRRLKGG